MEYVLYFDLIWDLGIELGFVLETGNAGGVENSATPDISFLRSVSSEQAIESEGRKLDALETGNAGLQQSNSEKSVAEDDLSAEREDPSEFITHRAKDFLSSIKDIEHRFFRASEAGREVSKMLEANKIRVGYSEAKGRSSVMAFLISFQLACCQRSNALVSHEPAQNGTKVITWKRSASSRSSSSRNPLNNDDSGSDFAEEFCMIAGSHSSTLDRRCPPFETILVPSLVTCVYFDNVGRRLWVWFSLVQPAQSPNWHLQLWMEFLSNKETEL